MKCLKEAQEIVSRWTEYCPKLYNPGCNGDTTVLDCSQHPGEDLQSILREEVEIGIATLKKRKSAEAGYISAEFVQAGGKTMVDVLTKICKKSDQRENDRPHALNH